MPVPAGFLVSFGLEDGLQVDKLFKLPKIFDLDVFFFINLAKTSRSDKVAKKWNRPETVVEHFRNSQWWLLYETGVRWKFTKSKKIVCHVL